MPTVELEIGRIHYEEAGPGDGRPVVCVHGYLMAGSLFGELAPRLAARGLRCIMPTWPLGGHREPMRPGADVTPRGVARAIAGFLEALELEDVVLLGNDTGGALCQLVALERPERLGALVLTNCDMFENFPPGVFKALIPAAKVPGVLKAVLTPMRSATVRRSPLAFGLLSHRDVDDLAQEWVAPALGDRAVFEDLRRFTSAVDPKITLDAAERLREFTKPVLFAWAVDDRLFPLSGAHRLAERLRDARVVAIEDSRLLSMIDQPDRLAGLVAQFAGARAPA